MCSDDMYFQLGLKGARRNPRRHQRHYRKEWPPPTIFVITTFLSTMAAGSSALDSQLLQKAQSIRRELSNSIPTSDDLFIPSCYEKPGNGSVRGFSNWVVPRRLMVGQYPGPSPEPDGPPLKACQSHLELLVKEYNVRTFCSLQSEIPAQTDVDEWPVEGVFLEPYLRKDFPHPFVPYFPMVQCISNKSNSPKFLHFPILDLSTPDSNSLLGLLETLLDEMMAERSIYLHCWGGRGRAGLTAACLLSLLYPEHDLNSILDWIQRGYDTRLGADQMSPGLRRSPQTTAQRSFVSKFVAQRQAAYQKHTS